MQPVWNCFYFKLEKYANYAENELKFYSDFA